MSAAYTWSPTLDMELLSSGAVIKNILKESSKHFATKITEMQPTFGISLFMTRHIRLVVRSPAHYKQAQQLPGRTEAICYRMHRGCTSACCYLQPNRPTHP